MRILGIESAGETAGVALMQDGKLLGEHLINQTRTHSETMMPMVEALMQALDISPADLSAIAVNIGPGSFTGVRIGVCAANAMGLALGIPVIGVSSLASLYENVRVFRGYAAPMIDARNGGAYAALFENGEIIREGSAVEADAYIQTLPPNTLFVGDGAIAYEALIQSKCKNAAIAPGIHHVFYARSLCSIAHAALLAGRGITMQAEPSYLKLSQAERMWESKRKESDT